MRLWHELFEFLVTSGNRVCKGGAVGELTVLGVAVLDSVVARLTAREEEGVAAGPANDLTWMRELTHNAGVGKRMWLFFSRPEGM